MGDKLQCTCGRFAFENGNTGGTGGEWSEWSVVGCFGTDCVGQVERQSLSHHRSTMHIMNIYIMYARCPDHKKICPITIIVLEIDENGVYLI